MSEESIISNVWTQRSLGIDISKGLSQVTSVGVEYLCNHIYPFIQLVNSEAVFGEEVSIKFIASQAGWVIHDYGNALSVSCPHIGATKTEDGNIIDKGISGQIKTIAEIGRMIIEKDWGSVELIAGTEVMKRILLVESKRCGFKLEGYEPTPADEKILELIKKQLEDNGQSWERPFAKKEMFAIGS